MSSEDVAAYLDGPFKEIGGWCNPFLWQAIEPLHGAISAAGPPGPVAEIGVFHGKFFFGLVKTAGAEKDNFAIDVFDMQEFNLDGAGVGDKQAFIRARNLAGIDKDAVALYRTDSMAITGDDVARLRKRTGGFVLFSVDGCHLPEHTINDIKIAMELTRPHGLIFVDDYYNPNWPGVQEGVSKLYLTDAPRFVPLLFVANKLFLCNVSFHQRYLTAVSSFVAKHHPDTRIKPVKRFGYDTITLTPQPRTGRFLAKPGG